MKFFLFAILGFGGSVALAIFYPVVGVPVLVLFTIVLIAFFIIVK
jgi:hypothetical protein